jgi:hypothetical protein
MCAIILYRLHKQESSPHACLVVIHPQERASNAKVRLTLFLPLRAQDGCPACRAVEIASATWMAWNFPSGTASRTSAPGDSDERNQDHRRFFFPCAHQEGPRARGGGGTSGDLWARAVGVDTVVVA